MRCLVCNAETEFGCTTCNRAYYCSREHINADAARHAPECARFVALAAGPPGLLPPVMMADDSDSSASDESDSDLPNHLVYADADSDDSGASEDEAAYAAADTLGADVNAVADSIALGWGVGEDPFGFSSGDSSSGSDSEGSDFDDDSSLGAALPELVPIATFRSLDARSMLVPLARPGQLGSALDSINVDDVVETGAEAVDHDDGFLPLADALSVDPNAEDQLVGAIRRGLKSVGRKVGVVSRTERNPRDFDKMIVDKRARELAAAFYAVNENAENNFDFNVEEFAAAAYNYVFYRNAQAPGAVRATVVQLLGYLLDDTVAAARVATRVAQRGGARRVQRRVASQQKLGTENVLAFHLVNSAAQLMNGARNIKLAALQKYVPTVRELKASKYAGGQGGTSLQLLLHLLAARTHAYLAGAIKRDAAKDAAGGSNAAAEEAKDENRIAGIAGKARSVLERFATLPQAAPPVDARGLSPQQLWTAQLANARVAVAPIVTAPGAMPSTMPSADPAKAARTPEERAARRAAKEAQVRQKFEEEQRAAKAERRAAKAAQAPGAAPVSAKAAMTPEERAARRAAKAAQAQAQARQKLEEEQKAAKEARRAAKAAQAPAAAPAAAAPLPPPPASSLPPPQAPPAAASGAVPPPPPQMGLQRKTSFQRGSPSPSPPGSPRGDGGAQGTPASDKPPLARSATAPAASTASSMSMPDRMALTMLLKGVASSGKPIFAQTTGIYYGLVEDAFKRDVRVAVAITGENCATCEPFSKAFNQAFDGDGGKKTLYIVLEATEKNQPVWRSYDLNAAKLPALVILEKGKKESVFPNITGETTLSILSAEMLNSADFGKRLETHAIVHDALLGFEFDL